MTDMADDREPIPTGNGRRSGLATTVGHANTERVKLRGHDLVDQLLGRLTYTEALLLAVKGAKPAEADVRAVDAVLVSLIDHGLQPSALAARMTYAAAPDAVQGAMAAGLLGAGSSILGSMEQAGKMLHDIGQAIAADNRVDDAVRSVVDEILADGRMVPGFGHRLHRAGDPRGARLLNVAASLGVADCEIDCLTRIQAYLHAKTGRDLKANATGAAAAILLGVGIPWQLHRCIAMVSRAAGLVAHIGEEMEQPITPEMRRILREASWLDEEDGGD